MKFCLSLIMKFSAIFCAIAFGCVIILHAMISGEGIPLNFARPMVETTLEGRLENGGDVKIGDIRLLRADLSSASNGPLWLQIRQVELFDNSKARTMVLPELNFYLTTGDLMRGSLLPERADIFQADFMITRAVSGEISIGPISGPRAAAPSQTRRAVSVLERMRTIGTLIDAPKTTLARVVQAINKTTSGLGATASDGDVLRILQGTAIIADETMQREVVIDQLETNIARKSEGFSAYIAGRLTGGKIPSQFILNATTSDVKGAFLSVSFSQMRVSDLLLILGVKHAVSDWQLALTGDIELSVSPDGSPEILSFDIQSEGTEGSEERFHLTADYNPVTAEIEISRFDIASQRTTGAFSGVVYLPGLDLADKKKSHRSILSFVGEDIILIFDEHIFAKPLVFSSAKVSTLWDWEKNELIFKNIEAQATEGILSGEVALRLSSKENVSMGILADARIDGSLSHEEVLHYWPVFLAQGPRAWVKKNILSGNASNIRFEMDLKRGAVRPKEPLPNEAMSLTFDVSDAVTTYVPSMSPLKDVKGRGVVGGSSFSLEVEKGRVGEAKFHTGIVNFPWFFPSPIGEFGATLTGDTKDILEVINEPPLSLISKTGLTPEMFSGEAEFGFKLVRPMHAGTDLSEYKFTGQGSFNEVNLADMPLFGDLALTDGKVTLEPDGISLQSDAIIQNVKTSVEWERKFDTQGSTQYFISGVLSALDTDNAGIPLRDYLRDGVVSYEILLEQAFGLTEKSTIKADFTAAQISLDEIGYKKRKNLPATATVLIEQNTPHPVKSNVVKPLEQDGWLVDMTVDEGDNLQLEGVAVLSSGGTLQSADLSKIRVKNKLDAALNLKRQDDFDVSVDINGSYIKIDNILKWFSISSTKDNKSDLSGITDEKRTTRFSINAVFDKIDMRNNVTITNSYLTTLFDQGGLEKLDYIGDYGDENYIEIHVQPSLKTDGKTISIDTKDFGKTWSSLFNSSALEGGIAKLTATTLVDGPIIGALKVKKTRLHDTPLIARLLSSASVQGLSDLLSNEGIELNEVHADLELKEGGIAIKRARATGPSVGVSLDGDVNFSEGHYDLHGALAPAYQVNSFLGDLPGIGELLISRKGEGLVAFSYAVKGLIEEPVVTVNALSLLTPGVLRRIFEPIRRKKRLTTDEILNEAISISESLQNSKDITIENIAAHPLPPPRSEEATENTTSEEKPAKVTAE